VLSIDLDRFKFVNDSLGHEVGDMLLCSVAECIREIVPPDALAVRYGGDEFVVLLERVASLPDIRALAEQIAARLRRPFALGSYVIYSSARIGIAYSSPEQPSPEHILKNADMALMRARGRSGGGIQVFDPAMRQELHNEARLEYELRQALTLSAQAFRDVYLQYQPIISMATGHLTGYEALVRWRHPELGQIAPDRFVTLAEEIGLIETLSWWILTNACRQLREWRSLPGGSQLVMQVNISPILLMQMHFADRVAAVLRDTDVPGDALKLEITESSTLDVEEVGLQSLEKLRALGVGLCIDDFGTGYSSLSRLRELPIETIKIDRVFISRMSSLNDGLAIVEMILALGETLKMDIVAEGVETNEQWQLLRAIGCVLGQGFLFSLPLDAHMAGELIGKRLTLEDRQFKWTSIELP
jgi:diguanylate cyclase (GGDEF)-like protein